MIDLLVVLAHHPAPDTKQPVERLQYSPGGQAATAMVTCSRLGLRARYVGRFGDDEHAARGIKSLEQEGIDTSACLIAPETPNGFSVILVDQQTGARTVLWSRDPGLRLAPEEIRRDAICTGRTLLVDCHDTAASTVAARCAREAGIPTVVDVEHVRPGIEDLLSEIDVIIAAEDFPTALSGRAECGAALRSIRDTYRASAVCMTLGGEGSLALVGDSEIRTPSFRVPVVDSTGAGDVFRGGFIAGWIRGGDGTSVEEILRYANAVAALKCRGLGARSAIPNPDEVDALLRGEAM